MKRVVGLTVGWLVVTTIGLTSRQAPDSTADLLASAVTKSQRCEAHAQKLDGRKEVQVSDEEVGFAKKLEIPLLFKEGRFRLKWKDAKHSLDREEVVILYTPLPQEAQLKPNEKIEEVMNKLSGTVSIDRETESITRVTGTLSDNVWLSKRGAPANLTVLSFTYVQAPRQGEWVPTRLEARARLWLGALVPWNLKYNLGFNCGS